MNFQLMTYSFLFVHIHEALALAQRVSRSGGAWAFFLWATRLPGVHSLSVFQEIFYMDDLHIPRSSAILEIKHFLGSPVWPC